MSNKVQKIYFESIDEILDMYKNNSKWFFADGYQGHFEFRSGVPCFVYDNGKVDYSCSLDMGFEKFYRIEPVKPKMATKDDIGKVCCFWCDVNESRLVISQLKDIADNKSVYEHVPYEDTEGAHWQYCSVFSKDIIEYWKEL